MADIVKFYTAIFMYQYTQGRLPSIFHSFSTTTSNVHAYGTHFASKFTFCFSKIRTMYGEFNIRYFGPEVCNDIDESLKSLDFWHFKCELRKSFVKLY